MIDASRETANAAFKRRATDWYWHSLALAAALHFVILAGWPSMSVAVTLPGSDDVTLIAPPPDVDVPPPPALITRPAAPVIGSADIDDAATLPSIPIDWKPELPQPSANRPSRELEEAYRVVPMTVAPRLLNGAEVERALERAYPRTLRDAGVGGVVLVHFLIDESGVVLRRQVAEPSGYTALDDAALAVAEVMRFAPALNRDAHVKVWVAIPVVFRTR